MRNSLPVKLEALRREHLKELFNLLEPEFERFGMEFYILGALARDVWYQKDKIQSRATRDIDLALLVFSREQFDELIHVLIDKHGFEKFDDIPFRLKTPFGYTLDLIPFGITSIDGRVEFEKGWDRPVYVNGFREVFDQSTLHAIDETEDIRFRVATLPAIVLLKLIAFDDRPEMRPQDPEDIRDIILHYFDIEDSEIYENYSDIFERDMQLHEYSAIVMGRQINKTIARNKALRERILSILSLQNRPQQSMVEQMVKEDITMEQIKSWFKLMKEEIE